MRSIPLRPKTDFESLMSKIGAIFVALPLAPFFLLFNGGYSILGMQWIAEHTGSYGIIFWSVVTFNTVNIPIAAKAGLPLEQPIAPWLFVFGVSFLQIAALIRSFNRNHDKPANDVVTAGLSVFDYVTTVIGLIFAPFTLALNAFFNLLWLPIAVILAVVITFGFEIMLALVFRKRNDRLRPNNS